MRGDSLAIIDRPIHDTPFAILDFETTGLTPGMDRVVEVSVVRMEPGRSPELVFDTLINPERPVAATEIHGITDDDVADAPAFAAISGELVKSLSGCVIGAYNVYFDMRFLTYELGQVGVRPLVPHLCLMYLRPLLGLGERCRLGPACVCYGIPNPSEHMSSSDALASAALMQVYLDEMKRIGVRSFRDLAKRRRYKFVESFSHAPIEPSMIADLPAGQRMKSRRT